MPETTLDAAALCKARKRPRRNHLAENAVDQLKRELAQKKNDFDNLQKQFNEATKALAIAEATVTEMRKALKEAAKPKGKGKQTETEPEQPPAENADGKKQEPETSTATDETKPQEPDAVIPVSPPIIE
jgi:chromosome segregation ATPase